MPRKAEPGQRLVALYARIPADLHARIKAHAAANGVKEARETERILRAGLAALYGQAAADDAPTSSGE